MLTIARTDSSGSDGPVLNVDDDAKIEPELLRRVWKVKRAISWPVGNLPAQGGCTFLFRSPPHARSENKANVSVCDVQGKEQSLETACKPNGDWAECAAELFL